MESALQKAQRMRMELRGRQTNADIQWTDHKEKFASKKSFNELLAGIKIYQDEIRFGPSDKDLHDILPNGGLPITVAREPEGIV